jgi:hypothetical protein
LKNIVEQLREQRDFCSEFAMEFPVWSGSHQIGTRMI